MNKSVGITFCSSVFNIDESFHSLETKKSYRNLFQNLDETLNKIAE